MIVRQRRDNMPLLAAILSHRLVRAVEIANVFVLLLAGGGDDLQGIKRGIIEMADMIAVTKADGDNLSPALKAAAVYHGALSILTPATAAWMPPVLTISAKENRGLDALWAKIVAHKEKMSASGAFQARRGEQAVAWLRDLLQDRLLAALRTDARVASRLAELEQKVRAEKVTPALAVAELVAMMGLGGHEHATDEG
jgi:LAO/AO transport system kinase